MSGRESYDNSFQDDSIASIGGKILTAAIIAVFVSVVFVILLHLYTRWTWRRYAAQDRSGRRRGLVFAPDSASAPINRGLEPSVIQSIPIVVFSPKQFKDGLECAVCLSELSDGDKARLLPKCNHGFHVDCIDMWFHSHSTCPLCRSPVSPEAANPQIQLPESTPESPMNFPTNVLFWGSQHQVSTGREEGTSSSAKSERDGMLVIEIPTRLTESFSSPSFRPPEGESSSPTLARLKRLLSRGKRAVPCSPHGGDLEQGIGGVVAVPSPKTPLNS